ncbi:hypothetical protein F66182_10670 [Fusarium sp. NRRL 66182]|nr:hypothetical protein F66182_10670 [Fusarium sp. NRRL 66182]
MAYRGSGGRGRGGRGGGPNHLYRTKVCHHFQRGHCHFGDDCNFLHGKSGADANNDAGTLNSSLPTAHSEAHTRYYAWRGLIRKNPTDSRESSVARGCCKLWQKALHILNQDDHEQHQRLSQDLVNDEFHGQTYITATIENGCFDHPESLQLSHSFFQVITHSGFVDSLSTETNVGTVYALFGGINGDRGVGFLRCMCEKLMQDPEQAAGVLESTAQDTLRVLLKALSELLNRAPRSRFCQGLPALLELMDSHVAKVAELVPRADLDELSARLHVVKRVITAADDGLAATAELSVKQPRLQPVMSTFPKDVEHPGGRHDNDFADISHIAILPTLGEITSEHDEYLPSTSFQEPHVLQDPLQRHLDSLFRLVRHDTLGPIKDTLCSLLRSDDVLQGRLSVPDSRTHVYLQSSIETLSSDQKHGVEAVLAFQNPSHLCTKTRAQQKTWWQATTRLSQGTLVCFISPDAGGVKLLFFQVTCKNIDKGTSTMDMTRASDVVPSHGSPSITVKLATQRQDDVFLLAKMFTNKARGVLVDFNGVIPDTFVPILKNLQKIKRENHIAFQRWILPGTSEEQDSAAPLYARRDGFSFPLKPIAKSKDTNLSLDPQWPDAIDLDELEDATGLDQGQCRGLVHALTREYALIQGPPGTGKSYLGVQLVRVLLAAKQEIRMGPILVICYTNHALDQFLKHLLDVGIDKIIRVGGRSAAPELDGLNLRVVSRETSKTASERMTLGSSFNQLESSTETASSALASLRHTQRGPSWDLLGGFLAEDNKEIHEQFVESNDGFTVVTNDPLTTWLGSRPRQDAQDTTEIDLEALTKKAEEDIHGLSCSERWSLVQDWMKRDEEQQTDLLFEAIYESEMLRKDISRVHDGINQRTLAQADVVGLTTTSFAGRIDMLRSLKPKIAMCEEAGEVKEADIISASIPCLEHMIQLGDHRQLRPLINNFNLSLESHSGNKWQLDRSQFERRAVGEPGLSPASLAQLNVQRRMRPEISQLIRRVYPDLKDHESVADLPDVAGMRQNLFWLDHNHAEDMGGDGTRVRSHSNKWETAMATALVRHLVRQGRYRAEDIALLTPYMGQLQQLKAALGEDFEICLGDRDREQLAQEGWEDGLSEAAEASRKRIEKKKLLSAVRLATVDNFQGEEAKVIIVSLVRSNPERKVGFLGTENRINVLLSRAKHGMYLMGNAATYLNVPMWADVYSILTEADAVEAPKEDAPSPAPGGWSPVGTSVRQHAIQLPCMTLSLVHDLVLASETLAIMNALDFAERIAVLETMACHQTLDLSLIQCTVLVAARCGLGASSLASIFFLVVIRALELVLAAREASTRNASRFVTDHTIHVTIVASRNATRGQLAIVARHFVRYVFSSVGTDAWVIKLSDILSRLGSMSSLDLRLALQQSVCAMHREVYLVLSSSGRLLDAMLGAMRPTSMRRTMRQNTALWTSVPNNKGKARVDLLALRSYAEIDLDESPIVVLGCGHFFTSKTLDRHVGLAEVYTMNLIGDFTGLKDMSNSLAEKMPCCPDCKRPIRQFATRRYNRVINRAVVDEIGKRFLVKGRVRLAKLNQQLFKLETSLNSSRRSTAPRPHYTAALFFRDRHAEMKELELAAANLQRRMHEKNLPTRMLVDAIAKSQSTAPADSQAVTRQIAALKLSPPTSNAQLVLGARLVALEAQEAQLMDAFAISKARQWTLNETALGLPSMDAWLDSCQELMQAADKAKLPRISISSILGFAKVSRAAASCTRSKRDDNPTSSNKDATKTFDRTSEARVLLSAALSSCSKLSDGGALRKRVQDMIDVCEPRYDKSTPEELASIRSAMVTGPQGMATHSGHWYNCVNGHPFAIGGCGMPVEVARCPECGERIGGTNHRPLMGVSRAHQTEARQVKTEPTKRPVAAPIQEGCVMS